MLLTKKLFLNKWKKCQNWEQTQTLKTWESHLLSTLLPIMSQKIYQIENAFLLNSRNISTCSKENLISFCVDLGTLFDLNEPLMKLIHVIYGNSRWLKGRQIVFEDFFISQIKRGISLSQQQQKFSSSKSVKISNFITASEWILWELDEYWKTSSTPWWRCFQQHPNYNNKSIHNWMDNDEAYGNQVPADKKCRWKL